MPDGYQIGVAEKMSHSFKVDEIVNVKGVPFLTEDARLSAVVLLVNGNTGVVENANKVAVTYESGTSNFSSPREIKSIKYYDLSGRRLSEPCTGISICRTAYTDGSVRTEKVMIK